MASTSCGTILPPNTRANASPTVDSSLRSKRSTRPISPPASLVVGGCSARTPAQPACRLAQPLVAWYRPSPGQREQWNCENWIAAGQRCMCGWCSRYPVGIAAVGERGACVIGSPGCWGEWRNGRRAGFRCQCPSGRGGSSPPSPTISSGSTNSRHKVTNSKGFVTLVFVGFGSFNHWPATSDEAGHEPTAVLHRVAASGWRAGGARVGATRTSARAAWRRPVS